MSDFYNDVLNKICLGIIIIDSEENIILWNDWMEKLTKIPEARALAKPITEICPRFKTPSYSSIIKTVIETGQSRFLSGAVHGTFFQNSSTDVNNELIRQNLHIEPIVIGKWTYALIQVLDVSNQYQKVQQMRNFIKNLESENIEIKQTEEESRNLALHDTLTGLPNRLNLMNQLMEMTGKPAVEDEMSAVIFLDLDDFKAINDTYGHSIGDALLQETALRLKASIRSSDFVARLAGDEFVLLIKGVKEKDMVETIANKIKNQFTTPFVLDDMTLMVTSSFGISLYPQDATVPDTLLYEADKALYSAKHSGKASFTFYEE
jgi:diguanylate cyclase